MDAKAELAELVEDHLREGADVAGNALVSVVTGLASILAAYEDARQRKGNWAAMLANLRRGDELVRASVPILRTTGGSGFASLVAFADRQVYFAGMMQDEIMRLQSGESTLV